MFETTQAINNSLLIHYCVEMHWLHLTSSVCYHLAIMSSSKSEQWQDNVHVFYDRGKPRGNPP